MSMNNEVIDSLCRNEMVNEGWNEHVFDNLSEEAKDIRRQKMTEFLSGIAEAMNAVAKYFDEFISRMPEAIVTFAKSIVWDTECVIDKSDRCIAHHYELVDGICPNKAMIEYVEKYEKNSEHS